MHVLCPSIRKKTPTIQPRKKPKTKRNWKYIWCGIIARSAILEKPSSTGQERKTPCTGLQLAKVKSPWNLGALCTEFPVLYSWTGSTVLWQMIKLVFKWSVGGERSVSPPPSGLLEKVHYLRIDTSVESILIFIARWGGSGIHTEEKGNYCSILL